MLSLSNLLLSQTRCKTVHFFLASEILVFLQWFGQMTPWCKRELREMAFKVLGADLAKRLLGADSALAWHQGFFWPDHPTPRSLLAKS